MTDDAHCALAQFIAELAKLRLAAGNPSLRRMEVLSKKAQRPRLPHSTAGDALKGRRLPARPFHTAYATYAAAQRQGTRTVQADGYAVLRDPITGRIAAAVADGIGDTTDSAWVARSEFAVRCGSPARAVREARARRNLRDLGCPDYDPDRDYWPGE